MSNEGAQLSTGLFEGAMAGAAALVGTTLAITAVNMAAVVFPPLLVVSVPLALASPVIVPTVGAAFAAKTISDKRTEADAAAASQINPAQDYAHYSSQATRSRSASYARA